MKTILTLLALFVAVTAPAQFRRSSDNKIYPYTTVLQGGDVYIIGRPGVTNYNYAQSNMLATMTNVANFRLSQTFNGNNITNITGQQVRYPTNQAASTLMDVGNKYTGYQTNGNMVIAGCVNIDASQTNISWGILTVTNLAGSAAVKTITIPTAWIDVDNLGGIVIYNTNQGVLSVMVYPGFGTNFIWRGK